MKVKVRIAVAVDKDGYWVAGGRLTWSDAKAFEKASSSVVPPMRQYIVEAELDTADANPIAGTVVDVPVDIGEREA